jgi:N-methylhydantoinase A
MMSADAARAVPARICQSGPAGGVVGGLVAAQAAGFDNVITFDMGGTSADLSLVSNGKPSLSSEWRVDWNIPILFPAIDLVAIGAGGGTIAWADAGGSLRSGPQSAGADPGPACLGKGNTQPTTTDAQLYLGRLNPAAYLGGDLELRPELAELAIDALAGELGLTTAETASGILRIANTNMTSATHLISVQRGYDPRDFTLVAGGGAGPLHAVDIARELGIPRVVVPPTPGLTSALGILHVDLRHDFLRSVLRQATEIPAGELSAVFDELVREAKQVLDREQIADDRRAVELSLDLRYYGQTPYLNLALDRPPADAGEIEEILERYESRYLREFGYVLPRDFASIEFVNARVVALGITDRAELPRGESGGTAAEADAGERNVYFDGSDDFVATAIYDRALLRSGAELEGPAIVEQADSTVLLPPGSWGVVDDYLNIVISVDGR